LGSKKIVPVVETKAVSVVESTNSEVK